VVQAQQREGAGDTALWRELGGKTSYRAFGALVLDELCDGFNTAGLLRRLRAQLGRTLSRQSLTAWRRGDLATPNDVMIATAVIVRRTLADAAITVVMRVLGDPDADPAFAEGLRSYYRKGRPEIPVLSPSRVISQVDETNQPDGAPRAQQTPLWRDRQGKTTYRVFGALVLDELCQGANMSSEDLRRRLRQELHRPLSRQTLAAWRRGDNGVPHDVMLATGAIVHRTPGEAGLVVAVRVVSDPIADPPLAALFRSYYSHGPSKIAARARESTTAPSTGPWSHAAAQYIGDSK
jgi:hypothetical protein